MTQDEMEELAEWMHDIYEQASHVRGWKTQEKCKVNFWDLPEENRRVMLDVAAMILTKYKKRR